MLATIVAMYFKMCFLRIPHLGKKELFQESLFYQPGLVQMVPDAITLAKIHRHSGLIGPLKENTIKKWFSQHNHLKADYEKVCLAAANFK